MNARPADWSCIEEPLYLAARLRELAAPDTCILVDCLTLWLSNLLFAGRAATQAEAGEAVDCSLFAAETAALVETLPQLPGQTVLVSNEVGWGIVPMHPVSRLFADEQGRLNQRVATVCERVTLVAAGPATDAEIVRCACATYRPATSRSRAENPCSRRYRNRRQRIRPR